MIKLIKNKKFLLLSCGLLLAFLFLAKTPSLAQTPTFCPVKPSGITPWVDPIFGWGAVWHQQATPNTSGSIRKTSGASSATGKCYSSWDIYYDDFNQDFTMTSPNVFCGCNDVGFKAYHQTPGCPEVVSDEFQVDWGGCKCAGADIDRNNEVSPSDQNTFNPLYASCLNCTPWTCNWSTCGKADVDRNGKIEYDDTWTVDQCMGRTFCWCGTRPVNDTPVYICEGRYFGQPQCKTKAVPHPQGACVLEPKWGKIDPRNPSSSTNDWKWTYCYPKGQTPVSTVSTPTASPQKVCEGKYFGEPQCRAKVTPKPGYSCQLNSVLGTINPTKLSDSINYWKWSYCKN